MQPPANCPFCRRIAAGDYSKSWPEAVAFTPINPVAQGHVLVVPRRHVEDARTDPALTAQVARRAAEVAPSNSNIVANIGPRGDQTVFHLHLHVVPRQRGDGLGYRWRPASEAGNGKHSASWHDDYVREQRAQGG